MTNGTTKRIHLTRRSPAYWRVTFDHPPLNIFGPETIPQLNEIITALETDEQVKVVVMDSAVDGFFLTHYDFLAKPEDTTRLPPGPTGLQQLPDMLVRLSRARVVSIVSIRGRATGVGSELALASDMRFCHPRQGRAGPRRSASDRTAGRSSRWRRPSAAGCAWRARRRRLCVAGAWRRRGRPRRGRPG